MATTGRRGGSFCAAINCSNYRGKRPDLSFFRFPREKERCLKWVQNSRREDLRGKDASALYSKYYLCGEHFEPSQFMNENVRIKLKWNAVPTLFQVPNPPKMLQMSRKLPTRHPRKPKLAEVNPGKNCVPHDAVPAALFEQLDSESASSAPCTANKTSDTPTKKRLRNQVNKLSVKVCRLKKKTASLNKNTAFTSNKPLSVDELVKGVSQYLSGASLELVKTQLKVSQIPKNGRRWSPEFKQFCILVYQQSPRAYRLLSRILLLPTRKTLLKFMGNINLRCGFDDTIFVPLKAKVADFKASDKFCVISFDEMSLKIGLDYDSVNDKVEGLEDYANCGSSQKIANHALVFMARGLKCKWKQPLGYFLSCDAAPADTLKDLLFECIHKLSMVGLVVVATVCDLGGQNRKLFFKLLGITESKPYFEFHSQNIFCLFDVPHLLKCTRNNLKRYNFEVDGKCISWGHITAFLEKDMKNTIRMAPKITKRHIELPPFSPMRVYLAAQLLSHSVAAGMYAYCSLGALPKEVAYTAAFIDKIDSLFDALNSSALKSKKEHNRPISLNSKQVHLLAGCYTWISNWKVLHPPTVCIYFQRCWLVTIASVLGLWKGVGCDSSSKLNDNSKLKFLLTRRLNQDPVENLFCVVRQSGGSRDNPTAQQFRHSFKTILITSLMKPVNGSNCKDDADKLFLSLGDFGKSDNSAFMQVDNEKRPSLAEEVKDCCESLPNDNTLLYIGGYLLCRCVNSHECQGGNCSLLFESNLLLSQPSQMFSYFKAYTKKTGSDFGSLIVPSQQFLLVCKLMETNFVLAFNAYLHKERFATLILSQISKEVEGSVLAKCCTDVATSILSLFVRMRVHFALQFMNRKMTEDNRKRKNRKASKIIHL